MKKNKAEKSAQRWDEGGVVKIAMVDGGFCYGRLLKFPLMAFYDLKSEIEMQIEDVIKRPILFKIWVMKSAITSGRWELIGKRPLTPDLQQEVVFFKQDRISKKLTIYRNGEERPAAKAECEKLENAAVWDAEHVEDRLFCHFNGTSCMWVESLRPK